MSKSIVFVGRDMKAGGLLYRAPLNTLNVSERASPRQRLSAVELVQRFDKIPTLKYDQFVRKAFI